MNRVAVLAIVTGVFGAVFSTGLGNSESWPPNAAQLLATLILAVVLEQRLFASHAEAREQLWPPLRIAIQSTVLSALAMAIVYATSGTAFAEFDAAPVDGTLIGLVTFVTVRSTMW